MPCRVGARFQHVQAIGIDALLENLQTHITIDPVIEHYFDIFARISGVPNEPVQLVFAASAQQKRRAGRSGADATRWMNSSSGSRST